MAKKSIPNYIKLPSGKEKGIERLVNEELAIIGGNDGNNTNPHLSLKYIQTSYQCFSEWQKEELKAFSKFIDKLRQMTWQQVIESSGKTGKKTGLGYDQHKNKSVLPNNGKIENISEDINFIELRVSDKARIHGFRVKDFLFITWLDREHKIYKM